MISNIIEHADGRALGVTSFWVRLLLVSNFGVSLEELRWTVGGVALELGVWL